MPICWNCDTEATEAYRDEHGVRKFLCDTCAEAWKSGYTYAANGSDTWPVALDGWGDDGATPAPQPAGRAEPILMDEDLLEAFAQRVEEMETAPLFPEYEQPANLYDLMTELGIDSFTLTDGRVVRRHAECIQRTNYYIQIDNGDGTTDDHEAGYKETPLCS